MDNNGSVYCQPNIFSPSYNLDPSPRSVYMGDTGPYTMPVDTALLPACRLLKGTFNFKEVTVD